MTTYSAFLPIAMEAMALARGMVRVRKPGSLTAKGDRDVASEVDYAVERSVRALLRDRTPGIGFLGEEEGGGNARSPAGLMWVLDPVDGTMNFVRDIPLCAVSLGLVEGGRPVLGAIDLPFLGSSYWAVENEGAFSDRGAIRVSTTDSLQDAIVALGDYAVGPNAPSKNQLRFAITEQLAARAQRVRMWGSASIDLAWLAEGRIDASIILANKPWDVTAGVLIAREAGARVLDKDGSDHTQQSTATIAANPRMADQIIDLIKAADSSVAHAEQRPPPAER